MGNVTLLNTAQTARHYQAPLVPLSSQVLSNTNQVRYHHHYHLYHANMVIYNHLQSSTFMICSVTVWLHFHCADRYSDDADDASHSQAVPAQQHQQAAHVVLQLHLGGVVCCLAQCVHISHVVLTDHKRGYRLLYNRRPTCYHSCLVLVRCRGG